MGQTQPLELNSEPEREQVDRVIHGDALEVLRAMPENSVHAIVTDPP